MSGMCNSTLFRTTLRSGELSDLSSRMATMGRVVTTGSSLSGLVSRPRVSGRRGIEVVRRVFKKEISTRLMKLVEVVVRGGRCERLALIFSCFLSEIGRCRGVKATCIASTFRLSGRRGLTIRGQLLSAAGCIGFRVRFRISATLVNNVGVEVKSEIISSSIDDELRELAHSLAGVRLGMNRYTP